MQDGIEKQTRRSLENLIAALKLYGLDNKNIVKVTIILKNMEDFPIVNRIYSEYFAIDFPAQSCVQVVKLPRDADIEIEAITYRDL